jgi:predicted branched-subunit amino acid permease
MTFRNRILGDPSISLAIKDMLLASVAMGTWGLVTGIAMVQSGLSIWQAMGMSLMVYAGSAQLASLPLIAAGAPILIIVASALIVNLRFVIYSVAMKPWFKGFSLGKKSIFGVGVTDVLAADFLRLFGEHGAPTKAMREHQQGVQPLVYFQWAALLIWGVWQAASLAGILLAHLIPSGWGLEFVATLALLAMLLPMISDRPSLVCVVVAGVVSVLLVDLPLNLGLLVSVLCGVAAAMMLDKPPRQMKAASH